MSFEQRYPVILVCCGSFNPITIGHVRMFEIARNFLERTGNHIVISGIVSPVHDYYGNCSLIPSSHRLVMCQAAVKSHSWLSVDPWECSQSDWVKTVKVLQHVANKVKNDFGVIAPYSNPTYNPPSKYPRNTVTLQPNGVLKNRLPNNYSAEHKTGFICTPVSNKQDDSMELNEASEPDQAGVILNRLGSNLKKVCCVRPVPLALSDNMVYGAAYDLRRTRVMLLCGSDLLESFGVAGLWSDEDICEIVSEYGIVCIPRSMEGSYDDDGAMMRTALDRLQKILCEVQGTVILVNDQSRIEIADISSTKSRTALRHGDLKAAQKSLNPDVLNYISEKGLYVGSQNVGG